jgi:glycosyltransferase involved in cell wall biosynthesis
MRSLDVAVPADRSRMDPRTGAGRVWHSVLPRLAPAARVRRRSPRRRFGLRTPDVWLAPGHEGPLEVAQPVVVVVHGTAWNLEPEAVRELVPREYAERFVAATEATLRTADWVVVPSEYARRGLVEGSGFDPARVAAIPHGVDLGVFHPGRAGGRATVARALQEDRPYVLFASIPSIRQKNLAALREAMALLAAQGLPHALVIAGGTAGGETPEELAAIDAELPGAPGRSVWLGHVDDATLAGLMAGADAFCLPSLLESFGLTALEALASGAPVVVSDRGALPEVVGDAALIAEPSAEALAAALERVLTDHALANLLREDGRARAEGFPWERTAAGWLEVLQRAARASAHSEPNRRDA